MAIETSDDPDAFLAFESDGWQRASSAYERYWVPTTVQVAAILLDLANVDTGTRLLDVCTGPGRIAGLALERGARPTGLDVAESFLSMARARHPEAAFERGDAEDLPFAADVFDAATCGFGLVHLPRPDQALREMGRVVVPGGRAAVSTWRRPVAGDGLDMVYGAITAHGDLGVELPHGPDFFQFGDAPALANALTDTGFSKVEARVVDLVMRLESADDLFAMATEGSVRVAALLKAQAAPALEAIRRDLKERVAAGSRADGAYQVPMPAVVAVGVVP